MTEGLLEEVMHASHMTEDELRSELAVMLYTQGKVSLGWAAELARMGRVQFQNLLASRDIPIHYDLAALEQDLAMVRQFEHAG